MEQHLKNIIDGMRQVLVLWSDNDYVIPTRGDFHKDAINLRNDAKHISSGLYKNVNKKKYAKTHDSESA